MAKKLREKVWLAFLSLAIICGGAASALSQTSAASASADSISPGNAFNDFAALNFILQHERELKLSPELVKTLAAIRSEYQKQTLKKRAAFQVAELELEELRAKMPVDMGAVEAKVKQSDALRTELRLDNIKAVEESRAKLSAEQRARLDALQKASPIAAGQDAATDTNIQQRVQAVLDEKYKDQKMVELETSEAVVVKVMDWAKTFGLVLGLPLAVLGVLLGLLGIKTVADIRTLATNARQEFDKTIETGKAELTKTIDAGNKDISSAVETASKQMDALTERGQKEVKQKSKEAEQTFTTLKNKGEDYLERYEKIEAQLVEITALAGKIPAIARNLKALETKVDSIEEQINIDSSNISSAQTQSIVSTLESYQKYFQTIGFNPPKGKIKVRVDSKQDTDNAYYDMKNSLMQIGSRLVDDVDVILRTYTHHALTSVKKEAWDSPSLNLASIEAALADYFPCSFTDDPLFGEKSVSVFRERGAEGQFPHPYLRNLDNERSFNEVDPDDPKTAEQHNVGEIWGGAFWKLRALLGQEATDKLLFKTWIATPITSGFGLMFVKQLLELHKQAGEENHATQIKAIFKKRGLKV
ncbi:MAG: hypothetical protein QOF02_2625 [Blastocatellia bacterium]|jgi:Spy/CpxP family protein refolding chaperone|nr:hypothetical protein [Blastocatellia bacterium]